MSTKWMMGVMAILGAAMGFGVLHSFRGLASYDLNVSHLGDGDTAEILNATMQIEISVPVDDSGLRFANSQGLASLVRDGEDLLMVTHNHWGEILQEKAVVTFYDAGGRLLKTMSGSEFISRIRYLDAGTLILASPLDMIEDGRPIFEADPAQVEAGDIVQVAQQEGLERMEVTLMLAEVESSTVIRGLPVYQIRSLEGRAVHRGDSGGGIWHDGKLVGNLWYTTMAEPESFSLFSSNGSDQAELEVTDKSYAARYPVDQLIAVQGPSGDPERGKDSEVP